MIFVVDDDRELLSTIEQLMNAHNLPCLCHASAADFLAEANVKQPGCVIIDLRMPDMDGLQLQKHLKDRGSVLSQVVLSGNVDVPMAVQMMERGARTVIQKPFSSQRLIDEVNLAIADSKAKAVEYKKRNSALKSLAQLTAEEQEVLKRLLAGKSNKEIAKELIVGNRTVDRRRKSVMDKLNAKSLPELGAITSNAGWPDNELPDESPPQDDDNQSH